MELLKSRDRHKYNVTGLVLPPALRNKYNIIDPVDNVSHAFPYDWLDNIMVISLKGAYCTFHVDAWVLHWIEFQGTFSGDVLNAKPTVNIHFPAGMIVFISPNWGHRVDTEEDCVAVSQSFLPFSRLESSLKFEKPLLKKLKIFLLDQSSVKYKYNLKLCYELLIQTKRKNALEKLPWLKKWNSF
jgi:hypothetical protein